MKTIIRILALCTSATIVAMNEKEQVIKKVNDLIKKEYVMPLNMPLENGTQLLYTWFCNLNAQVATLDLEQQQNMLVHSARVVKACQDFTAYRGAANKKISARTKIEQENLSEPELEQEKRNISRLLGTAVDKFHDYAFHAHLLLQQKSKESKAQQESNTSISPLVAATKPGNIAIERLLAADAPVADLSKTHATDTGIQNFDVFAEQEKTQQSTNTNSTEEEGATKNAKLTTTLADTEVQEALIIDSHGITQLNEKPTDEAITAPVFENDDEEVQHLVEATQQKIDYHQTFEKLQIDYALNPSTFNQAQVKELCTAGKAIIAAVANKNEIKDAIEMAEDLHTAMQVTLDENDYSSVLPIYFEQIELIKRMSSQK